MAGVGGGGGSRMGGVEDLHRQPAIGREMPAGRGPPGPSSAAPAVAICRIGSSSGNITTRPRAAWAIVAPPIVGIVEHEPQAVVGLLAQRHREPARAAERHAELVATGLSAALAEQRVARVVRSPPCSR